MFFSRLLTFKMAYGYDALRFAEFGALPKQCTTAKDIKNHSFIPDEEEILLLPARKLRVESCLDSGNGLHIVQLEEIKSDYDHLESVPVPDPVIKPNNSSQAKSSSASRTISTVPKSNPGAVATNLAATKLHKKTKLSGQSLF
ncbi:unnamed protein product [Rotaria sp. Silwood2]|nr:unnamed protein product [Rotaria sp. Silwood2]